MRISVRRIQFDTFRSNHVFVLYMLYVQSLNIQKYEFKASLCLYGTTLSSVRKVMHIKCNSHYVCN
jgi:hypothetical protein